MVPAPAARAMKTKLRALHFVGAALLFAACTSKTVAEPTAGGIPVIDAPPDNEPAVQDQPGEVDQYLKSLPYLPVSDPKPKTELPCDGACPAPIQDGDYYCTYKHYTETAQFDRFVAFQPNSATLWPGDVVRGKEAQDGLLTPVGVELAPVTFSISLENIAASPVGHMDKPSLSAFRDARNAILASELTGVTPATFEFEITEIHSASDLALAVGGGIKWPGGSSLAGSFDFSTNEKTTKVLVNFVQSYYTIDVDTPVKPSAFFGPNVTVAELKKFVDTTSPPLYVQSITYGRRVLFTVETNEKVENIKAALKAAYKGAIKADAKVSTEYQQMLSKSNIKAFVYGGSGTAATGAVGGLEGLLDYIKQGGDYSKDSPGAPIAYKLAYLDNAVAKLAFTTEYTEQQCEKTRATLRIELIGFQHVSGDDTGENVELTGELKLRYPTPNAPVNSCDEGGAVATVWSLPGGHVSFKKTTTYKPANPIVVYVHDVPVGDTQNICLSSHMLEVDWPNELSADDDMGTVSQLINAKQGWSGDRVLHMYGKGSLAVDVLAHIDVQ
jgi:thiol-activated cytolysin